jgi:hypothetical protein
MHHAVREEKVAVVPVSREQQLAGAPMRARPKGVDLGHKPPVRPPEEDQQLVHARNQHADTRIPATEGGVVALGRVERTVVTEVGWIELPPTERKGARASLVEKQVPATVEEVRDHHVPHRNYAI